MQTVGIPRFVFSSEEIRFVFFQFCFLVTGNFFCVAQMLFSKKKNVSQ
jgi:hypothetical protein